MYSSRVLSTKVNDFMTAPLLSLWNGLVVDPYTSQVFLRQVCAIKPLRERMSATFNLPTGHKFITASLCLVLLEFITQVVDTGAIPPKLTTRIH